nr:trehalose-phosphatase [Quercus suber]
MADEYFAPQYTSSATNANVSTSLPEMMVDTRNDVSDDDDADNRVPVTPGISHYSYLDPMNSTRLSSRNTASQTRHNSSTAESNVFVRPRSPTELAGGVKGEELLRRLSLAAQRQNESEDVDADPRIGHEGLHLSGHVISTTFTVPYKIAHKPGEAWELKPRRGTSALFDSFSYLASTESPWNHTLVGWTGEIDKAVPSAATTQPNGEANKNSSLNATPVNKSSAPIPLGSHAARTPNPSIGDPSDIHITEADRARLVKQLEQEHGGRVAPVWLADETDSNDVFTVRNQSKWRRYGEHEIFTLFHYKQNEPSDGRDLRKAWGDYYKMNRMFADAVMSVYKPGDIVLVHDYHLLLLPSLLRQRMPNIYVGFFLHVPFPSSEYYRCLTRRKEILEGVLGASMIGFQAYSYSRHFSSCCTRILGFDSSSAGVDAYGAHVAVGVFPIGINAEATIQSAFGHPEIEDKMKALREMYGNKKIIVGRDRLDSVRGVAQKLQAFEIFLERHPEWHDQVVLIQVTSPTSIEDRDDRSDKTANKISDLVARINGNFGSLSFAPVQHYPQYLSQEEYFALLRIADLALITSVRDGMNTTALEYVICQRDNHGPLIISEFSGTAGSLGEALHINPWDLSGTADAIDIALTMSEPEKQTSHQILYDHVTKNTIQAWTTSYLKRLLTNLNAHNQAFATPALDRAKLLSQYRNSKRRLFMFDYDGTLTPIVKDPQSAIPSDRVIRTLKSLASDPNNAVWIISGRDQAFLDEWMGHISELGLSAEHGCFMRLPSTVDWDNLAETYDMSWQDVVVDIFQHYTEATPGAFVERKKVALTWHYRRADPIRASQMVRECQKHLEDTVARKWDVEIMSGKANLEVRPRFVNKGEIAKRLIKEYGEGAGNAPDFVFCLGDDFTDEGKLSLSTGSHPREDWREADQNPHRHVPRSPRLKAPRRSRLCHYRWRQL